MARDRKKPATRHRRPLLWPAEGSRWRQTLRMAFGLLLVPVSIALGRTLLRAATAETNRLTVLSLDAGIFAFLAGAGLFALAFLLLPRPTTAYIFAHEFTHAIFAWLHGIKVRNLKIGTDHGSIQIEHPRSLVLLAPYFFPLYTAVAIVLTALLLLIWPLQGMEIATLALIGMTWGFHFCFTITSLLQHQTDLERCGYIFSYGLIISLNLLVLALGLVAATPLTLRQFGQLWGADLTETFATLRDTFVNLHDYLWSRVSR